MSKAGFKAPAYPGASAREQEAWAIAFEAFACNLVHPPAAEDMWAVLTDREKRDMYDIACAARDAVEVRFEARLAELEERMAAMVTPANWNMCDLRRGPLLPGPDGRRK